jgi:hypothetical protein
VLLQVSYYSNKGYAPSINTMPYVLMCPGSKAAEFFSCFAHPDAEGGLAALRTHVALMLCYWVYAYLYLLGTCRYVSDAMLLGVYTVTCTPTYTCTCGCQPDNCSTTSAATMEGSLEATT